MEVGIVLKVATVFFGVLGAGKAIHDLSAGSKVKLRDEYRFSKEFLKDLTQEPKPHPLAIEKGYYAIAGTTSIKSTEIEYILSLENPDRCLKDYSLSRKYLEHLNSSDNIKLAFAKKYKKRWARLWRKTMHLTMYITCGFLSMFPFILQQILNIETKQVLMLSAITIPAFGFFAFDSLYSFIKICRAESLVKNQKKHTKLILL